MDLFELFENDNDRSTRRDRPGEEEPRKKGVRGFFQRWMAVVSDDDDDDRSRRDSNGRRRGADRDWD